MMDLYNVMHHLFFSVHPHCRLWDHSINQTQSCAKESNHDLSGYAVQGRISYATSQDKGAFSTSASLPFATGAAHFLTNLIASSSCSLFSSGHLEKSSR
mmetsp:Transcript_18769/g.28951  ORF Transcript_18769/g.28951 Transcript_18769/m.28951 type:complete len:99 (-) Transcript_18769:1345-1641(-)